MKKIIISILCIAMLALCSCDTSQSSTSRGIAVASINDKGELIVSYTDGTKDNLGVVVGKDGENGVDGKDGVNGKDGVDGKDGLNGIDGKNGVDGKDGKDGANGSDGAPGKDGVDGKDGRDGVDYGKVDQFNIQIDSVGDNLENAVSKAIIGAVSIVCMYPSVKPGVEDGGSSGSGVIYTLDKAKGDALIITNYHVVYNSNTKYQIGLSEDISVFLYGSEYSDWAIPATFVGGSLNYDIAVLLVENSDIIRNSSACAVTFADSDEINLGDSAIAIGNAEGMGMSVTRGIISVMSEYIDLVAADGKTTVSYRMMRMDTPVNHGNSGGGLFNNRGELIGIVSAKHIEDGVEGIGYAIPSNLTRALVNNIIDNCLGKDFKSVRKALLGITVSNIDSKSVYDIETGTVSVIETTSIQEVSETSSLYGKLLANDIIKSITVGERTVVLQRQYQLLDILLYARVGDTVTINVDRTDDTGNTSNLSFDVVITESHISTVE